MSGVENSPEYQRALLKTKIYRDPEGFTSYEPTSKGDKIQIKQNNTIQALILELSELVIKLGARIALLENRVVNIEKEVKNNSKGKEITTDNSELLKTIKRLKTRLSEKEESERTLAEIIKIQERRLKEKQDMAISEISTELDNFKIYSSDKGPKKIKTQPAWNFIAVQPKDSKYKIIPGFTSDTKRVILDPSQALVELYKKIDTTLQRLVQVVQMV